MFRRVFGVVLGALLLTTPVFAGSPDVDEGQIYRVYQYSDIPYPVVFDEYRAQAEKMGYKVMLAFQDRGYLVLAKQSEAKRIQTMLLFTYKEGDQAAVPRKLHDDMTEFYLLARASKVGKKPKKYAHLADYSMALFDASHKRVEEVAGHVKRVY